MLKIDKGTIDINKTNILKGIKRLKAKSNGSFDECVIQAAYYAKKHDKLYFCYSGNCYGKAVWRCSYKKSDYLCGVGNTGSMVISISASLEFKIHIVKR